MHRQNLEKAKMLLRRTGSTCVLCSGDVVLTDSRRGVRPLLELLDSQTAVSGFSAADKVVGKAAAYLYCLLQINCLYTPVISIPALAVLHDAGIEVEYDLLVDAIQNRAKDGFCPMEQAVWNIHNPQDALLAIKEKLRQLSR